MAENTIHDRSARDRKVTVVFPTDFLKNGSSGFLYGVTETDCDSNCDVSIYVTSINERMENDENPWLKLLGTYNLPLTDSNKSDVWLELGGKDAKLNKLLLENVNIPPQNVLLITYDQLLLKSKLLDHNINWTKSKTFQGLKNAVTNPCDKKEEDSSQKFTCGPFSLLSKVIHQLHYRYYQWTILNEANTKAEHYNLLYTIFFDFLLGLICLLIFHSVGGPIYAIQSFLASFKGVADNLQNLVEWLNGVPVGLKLNRQLSTVLARFFLYHLYLWKTYIDIITLILSGVLTILMFISILGFSFQVALFSDMIKLASLHAYCFYVYAARLYGVAVQGLVSTLRMFKGSKWNPLRQRVDSGHFSWDQLCIGMFIASSLLMLLPTILVYYIVFLLLRIIILLVQGTLERLIWLLNSLPLYSLLLWLTNSPTVAGDVQFEVMSSATNEATGPSVLKLSGIKVSLAETLRLSLNGRTTAEWPETNLFQMLTSIVTGKLIYPL